MKKVGKKNRQNAHKRNAQKEGCSCPECIDCCQRDPGWFLPDEIPIAAAFMNLAEAEFVEQFCQEHRDDNVIVLAPKQKPGTTECIFLDRDGMCQIHAVKPHECRKVFGCGPEARHRRIREIIRRQWK